MSPIVKNYGPIPVLEEYLKKAIETGDWFDAIVFSAIHVERYGCDEIRSHLKTLKVEESLIEAILDRISLLTVAKCLRELSIIDKSERDN